ncbi:MAG: response regulator [Eubacterium sp.]|nr:response regulator [Eubacterium sp.]
MEINAEDITSDYKQTIYDQNNGLGSSEINCIYQTKSGYIWVGTDGGLYRFNGVEFKLFNLWNTDKADVYYINSLFQDSQGRLWVATNNYGLFRIHGSDIYHFSDEYYSGVKCVNDVCEAADGTIYVATAYGVYTVKESNDTLVRNEDLAKHNIKKITLADSYIWGIYNGNTIFSIDQDGNVAERPSTDYTQEELSTISSDIDGNVYIGTIGNEIISLRNFDDYSSKIATRTGINKIINAQDRVYVCTDSGIGYFYQDEFKTIDNLNIDSYVSDMLFDYEGNLWIASSKSGLLYMAKSKFTNINRKYGLDEVPCNSIAVVGGYTYIGTDEGLCILNKWNMPVEDEITEYLKGVAIRDIMVDSDHDIWISTYRRYGVVKYSRFGTIKTFNKASGLLSNLVNCTTELSDGRIAVGTEDGISIISSNEENIINYNYETGLEYSNITAILEGNDGKIYAGSDGGGLYILGDGSIKNYTDADGLTSNVVSTIAEGKSGIWIGTNNGLTFYNGTFRSVSNIDFSNNIYSILMHDDKVYIVGSKGLIYATEEELLSTAPLSERYYSSGDGIENRVSINSHSEVFDNIVYVCTNSGMLTFDTENIKTNDVPPKMTVSEIDIDGVKFYFDQMGSELIVPSDTQRIEISFAVLSFFNRDNIQVEYQLVGFDDVPEVLTGNDTMQAVYTNLDGGSYTFRVNAVNGDGVRSQEDLTFTINKKEGFFELRAVRTGLVVLIILALLIIMGVIFMLYRRFISKNTELEDLTKKHEDTLKHSTAKTDYLANMSNDIKLPLNAMISSANTMLKDGPDDEKAQSELLNIIEKGKDVLGKVDETILLARLESGAVDIISEPYSITTLICDLSDGMVNKLSNIPIKFLVDIGENISDILVGDFDKIKNIVEILLDNAIRYTKEGSITLSVDYYRLGEENSGGNLVFSVADTGSGISPERLEHIFEIYYIDESKQSVINTGNGVSLSIAKRMAEIMGGDIDVDSTYGAGATFTFSLYQRIPEKSKNGIPLNDNTIERVSREEAERMWAPDLHVLVVDDNELSRKVSTDVVETMEIKCDTAASGLSAIDMVMNNDYDLVLMDIGMPVMNGIDAMREIRELADEKYEDLPVIAMSEDVIGKNRQEIIEEGFQDVILKPFDITVLASVLMRFASPEKVKFKTNDVIQYLSESRYSEGLKKLEEYFDVAGVLGRIGGNIDVYNRILSTFYNQNKTSVQELKQKFNSDYRGFRNKIHSVRTGCQNVGAVEAAEIALRIENAMTLGNKTYARDNLNLIFECLNIINESIEKYLGFLEKEKGLSDEEYAERHSISKEREGGSDEANMESDMESDEVREQSEENDAIVNIASLRLMKECTYYEDLETVQKIYDDISAGQYGAEDMDFINVLGQCIERGDMVEINELLGTYISLKS